MRSFTEKSRSIISSVIGMAKDLGIKTLAEGVETPEHADFLASIGCGRQQGFFYGKPRPLAGTLAHIREERRGIEQRKWCHYYDVASMVIRQTDRTSALFDALENGRLRFLYTNRAYREQLQALGYRLQDVEENLSIKGKPRSMISSGKSSTARARAIRRRPSTTSTAATTSMLDCASSTR